MSVKITPNGFDRRSHSEPNGGGCLLVVVAVASKLVSSKDDHDWRRIDMVAVSIRMSGYVDTGWSVSNSLFYEQCRQL